MKESKEAGDYLFQISNNVEEKVGVIEAELKVNSLPRDENGHIKIVELGTGGGESLRRLKEQTGANKDVEIIASDIIPRLVSSLKRELDVKALAVDAGHLPFKDESVSAINASALLHEVSSYGTKEKASEPGVDTKIVRGKKAVIQVLGELNRVLLPGGVVAYRDVLAPRGGDLKSPKRVEYNRKSWESFAKWFLPDFVKDQPQPSYRRVNIEDSDPSGFALVGSAEIQREFQRHYLMLRDYLRTIVSKEFGITTLRAEWADKSAGLKSVTFTVDERIAQHLDLSLFETHKSSGGMVYRGDSDQFDKLYDDVMEYYFVQMSEDSGEGKRFKSIIDQWKEREGSESYLYGNVNDLLEFSVEASKENKSDYYLLPESPDDIVIAPRFYYDRYLGQVADDPEEDGKQIVTLRKLSRDRAMQALNHLASSDSLDADSLERLRLEFENIVH